MNFLLKCETRGLDATIRPNEPHSSFNRHNSYRRRLIIHASANSLGVGSERLDKFHTARLGRGTKPIKLSFRNVPKATKGDLIHCEMPSLGARRNRRGSFHRFAFVRWLPCWCGLLICWLLSVCVHHQIRCLSLGGEERWQRHDKVHHSDPGTSHLNDRAPVSHKGWPHCTSSHRPRAAMAAKRRAYCLIDSFPGSLFCLCHGWRVLVSWLLTGHRQKVVNKLRTMKQNQRAMQLVRG